MSNRKVYAVILAGGSGSRLWTFSRQHGRFVQDTSKPDGTMRKVRDVSRIQNLGWKASISLQQEISQIYSLFSEVQA